MFAVSAGIDRSNRQVLRRAPLAISLACAACSTLALAGCGRNELPRLADYLDELEFEVPLTKADYAALGTFEVAVSANAPGFKAANEHGKLEMTLKFELSAETAPDLKQDVEADLKLHRGALSDAVLTVVRTSSVEELTDPRLAAIKARLTEAAAPIFGKKVRQLVFNKPSTDSSSSTQAHAPAKTAAPAPHH